MKRTFITSVITLLILVLLGARPSAVESRATVQQETPAPPAPEVEAALNAALQAAVQANRVQVLGFLVYQVVVDHIQISTDGTTALLWLGFADPETGEVIAGEPALSIAHNIANANPAKPESWEITLYSAQEWHEELSNLPADLVSDDMRMRLLQDASAQIQAAAGQTFSGYRLPWAAGLEKRVTWSIGHVMTGGSCPLTCRYAFDFSDSTMFPLLAAKGGTVKEFKWSCPNFGTDCTNYLILEDQSTTPTTYQIYYHMAYDSIPQRLRQLGAQVLQGEYVGDVDDTGASTGHHLHYHVYTSPTVQWYWGYSVDITFDDVSINGGRPRTCSEATNWPNFDSSFYAGDCNPGPDGKRGTGDDDRFRSGNKGAYPPVGDISSPGAGYTNPNSKFTVTGFTHDDQAVTRVQVLGFFNNTWNNLGDASLKTDGTFTKELDVCPMKLPAGSVGLALRIFDREGNQALGLPGQRIISNNFRCYTPPPPPACQPGTNEVALYADPDYYGACKKFGVGNFPSTALGAVGDNNAESIQIGPGVRAVLYDFSSDVGTGEPFSRLETIERSDPSLADNLIGANRVSGLWVHTLGSDLSSPLEPFLTPPGAVTGLRPTSKESLILAWEGGEGANQFSSQIKRQSDNVVVKALDWQYTYTWSIGNLPAGTYIWTVTARNSANTAVTNTSAPLTFTVDSQVWNSTTPGIFPYSQGFESITGDWQSSGLWRQAKVTLGNRPETSAWIFNDGTDYKDDTRRAGDLTSPPVNLPAGGEHYLRFSSYSAVEDGNPYWDQRRVQLSVNDGPFYDLYQFTDDFQAGPVWINSPGLKLVQPNGQPVNGASVRVRFHFDTIDEDYNTLWGWMIDDVSINTTPPDLSCADNNNRPDQAEYIWIGQVVSATICGIGDVDYYVFSGRGGQTVQFDIDANPLGLNPDTNPGVSRLDSYIFLMDSSGRNVLRENDDETPNTGKPDSRLTYLLRSDDLYYLKVRAWDHPGVSGPQFFYKLKTVPFAGDVRSIFLPVINQ